MFDIGWAELFFIGVLVLLVMGPRELPKVLYEFGKWARRARGMAREFQRHVDDMVREAEIEDIKKQAQAASGFNLRQTVESAVDPDGELRFEGPDAARPASVSDQGVGSAGPRLSGTPPQGVGIGSADDAGVAQSTPDFRRDGEEPDNPAFRSLPAAGATTADPMSNGAGARPVAKEGP